MSRSFVSLLLVLLALSYAAPAFAAGLYEDPATGQIYSRPGEGRVALQAPADSVSALYEDPDTGLVYARPGKGRAPLAMSTPAQKPQAEAGSSGYAGKEFVDAVKGVMGDEEKNKYPKITVGALFYGEYFYDFHNEIINPDGSHGGRNKFALNRGYINLRAELTPEIKVRVTPDITRDALGDYKFRLKYGYVGFHDFLKPYPSFEVKLGQFEGAWLDYEENLWTYRMQGTMLVEREGFMDSANLGVSLQGKLPAGYGEWQGIVDNGEGYHADETNKYKSFQARLTLVPAPRIEWLKGLNITGFYTAGKEKVVNTYQLQRDRAIAFMGYKYRDDLFVGGEYLWTRGKDKFIAQPASKAQNLEGNGFSAMVWYRMPFLKPLRLMGRYDYFDHDHDSSNNSVNRYIYGISYDLGKYVTFLVNNEHTTADKGLKAGATKEQNENLLKVDVQWKY